MQHVFSALFLPAPTFSGYLLALAALLAGAVLISMMIVTAVRVFEYRGRQRVIVSTSNDPELVEGRARSARNRR